MSPTTRNTKDLLLPFYFGSLDDSERLLIERELLSDTETLLDYLDIKRKLEAAVPVPAQPSRALWERLKPKTAKQKTLLSISVGAAIAAGFALFIMLHTTPEPADFVQPDIDRVLFDSSAELPASSGVL